MYNNEDIKKIVEDAIKNMDPNGELFKNVVSQITKQINDEQKKVEHQKITNVIKNKADTYLKDNKSLKDYISNRNKFMDVFEKITQENIKENLETKNIKDDYCDHCECSKECEKETNEDSKNISYTSYMSGFNQAVNEDGNPIGYLYFNFNSNNEQIDIYKQLLDYYSILTLYADEWDNWELFHHDYNKKNFYLSVLIDDFTYHFNKKESEIVDNDEDNITSFIYTKLDDDREMFSIYILNYSVITNKLYDFIRIIITLPDEITEPDAKNYYINLQKYFSEKQRIINLIEDYTYTFINRFKVNHHIPVKEEKDMYVLLQGDIIHQIIDKIELESTKIEFTKEDTPDKINSILDKLGIPYDEKGNVEIPITDRTNPINQFETKEEKKAPMYQINTGYDNYSAFLSNAINDGYIKIAGISLDKIHIEINGTYVIMKNPYIYIGDRDFYGNKID